MKRVLLFLLISLLHVVAHGQTIIQSPHTQLSDKAQIDEDLAHKFKPKKVIDQIEIIGGSEFIFPSETGGYTSYINKTSFGAINYRLKKKVGYSVGLCLIDSIDKRWKLGLRIVYEKKGYRSEETINYDTLWTIQDDIKSKYLTYSIYPIYCLDRKNKLSVFAGPSYSRLLNSYNYSSFYVNNFLKSKNRLLSGIRKYEIAIFGGLNYNFWNKRKNDFTLQFLFSYGLSYIYDTQDTNPNPDKLAIKTSSVFINLIYRLSYPKFIKPFSL